MRTYDDEQRLRRPPAPPPTGESLRRHKANEAAFLALPKPSYADTRDAQYNRIKLSEEILEQRELILSNATNKELIFNAVTKVDINLFE